MILWKISFYSSIYLSLSIICSCDWPVTHCVGWASLKLTEINLPLLPKCWNWRHVLLYPARLNLNANFLLKNAFYLLVYACMHICVLKYVCMWVCVGRSKDSLYVSSSCHVGLEDGIWVFRLCSKCLLWAFFLVFPLLLERWWFDYPGILCHNNKFISLILSLLLLKKKSVILII